MTQQLIRMISTVFGVLSRIRFDLAINIMTINSFLNNEINVYGISQERSFFHCEYIVKPSIF